MKKSEKGITPQEETKPGIHMITLCVLLEGSGDTSQAFTNLFFMLEVIRQQRVVKAAEATETEEKPVVVETTAPQTGRGIRRSEKETSSLLLSFFTYFITANVEYI